MLTQLARMNPTLPNHEVSNVAAKRNMKEKKSIEVLCLENEVERICESVERCVPLTCPPLAGPLQQT